MDNKAFDIIDARCNHEDSTKYVYKVCSLQNITIYGFMQSRLYY